MKTPLLLCLVALPAAACAGTSESGARKAAETTTTRQQADPGPLTDPILGAPANQRKLRDFCERVRRKAHDRASVAVLPFVFENHTFVRGKKDPTPKVMDGSLDLARSVIRDLRVVMPNADVLELEEVELRFEDLNSTPIAISNTARAHKYAQALGVDLVVYGTIRKYERPGEMVKDLQIDVFAAPASKRGTQTGRWTIPSNNTAVRPIYRALDDNPTQGNRVNRSWRIADDWSHSYQANDFDEVVDEAQELLRERLERMIGAYENRLATDYQAKLAAYKAKIAEHQQNDGGTNSEAPIYDPPPPLPEKRNMLIGRTNVTLWSERHKQLQEARDKLRGEGKRLRAKYGAEDPDYDREMVTVPLLREELPFNEARRRLNEMKKDLAKLESSGFRDDLVATIESHLQSAIPNSAIVPASELHPTILDAALDTLERDTLSKDDDICKALRALGLGFFVTTSLEAVGEDIQITARFVDLDNPDEIRRVSVPFDGKWRKDLTDKLGV